MRLFLPTLFFCSLFAASSAAEPVSALAGTWRIDLARSTELSPWRSFDLTIEIAGPQVTINRRLAWGRRDFTDKLQLDTSRAENVLPIEWWADNRHLGAYIGDDRTRRVRAQWLDGGRVLRLDTDLTLEAQQGPRAVNILSDYKVSASAAQLTLTELRSTRNRPVVYVFNRLAAPPAAK